MRVAVALTVVVGCGRVGFELEPSRFDAPHDDVPPGCWPQWLDHTVSFSAPRRLTELASATAQHNAVFSADGTTLFFSRGASGSRDIYTATRPTAASMFGMASVRDDVSSPGDDAKLGMTGDELWLVISSNRTGSQAFDLWELSRATTADAFASQTLAPFTAINTADDERDPHLGDDGLTLYYAAAGSPGQEIRVATRTSRAAAFGASVKVEDLGTAVTADPHVSPDERVIVYAGSATATAPSSIYYATRPTATGPFANPQPVPGISAAMTNDADPALSRDGCELLFSSTPEGVRDVYLATVQ